MAMLEAAAPTGREIHFIHASRNREVQAFRAAVEAIAGRHPNVHIHFCLEQGSANSDAGATGLLDSALLRRWLPSQAAALEAYFVGPAAFMAAMKTSLGALGVADTRMHWEFFGPAEALA